MSEEFYFNREIFYVYSLLSIVSILRRIVLRFLLWNIQFDWVSEAYRHDSRCNESKHKTMEERPEEQGKDVRNRVTL